MMLRCKNPLVAPKPPRTAAPWEGSYPPKADMRYRAALAAQH